MTDTEHTDAPGEGEAPTEKFRPPAEIAAPYPKPESAAEEGRSKGLVVTAAVLVVCIIAAAVGLFVLSGHDDVETADPASTDTTTTTEAATTAEATTTTEVTTTTAAAAPPPSAAPPVRSVLDEPAGQFCRDLNAKGYNYAEAVTYWEHHGRPSQMDASGMGIPCRTVYPRSEVEARWGQSATSIDFTSPLLAGYQSAMATFRSLPMDPRSTAEDLAILSDITSTVWTEEMLIALASSYCNDWDALPIDGGGPSERGILDWSAAIAPVLGINEAAAQSAIRSDVWPVYQFACS